jgi:hypothetical protein
MFGFKRKKPSGVLYVSKSKAGEEAGLYLETFEHPDKIANKKYVTFEVQVITPKSQK